MSKVTEYLRGHLLGEVSVRAEDRKRAGEDNGVLEQTPEMVVYPRNTNDIRKMLRFSWQLAEKGHVMPIAVRGSGQNTTGAALTKGVVLDTSRHLTRIFEYDSKQRLVRLQPGVSNDTLNEALTLQGAAVMSLLDMAGTVGGGVADYTAGPYAGKYGSIASAVDKLEVVLANGDLIQTGRLSKKELDHKKGLQGFEGDIYRGIDAILEDSADVVAGLAPEDSSGYGGIAFVKDKSGSFDLTPLFVGSQGTLGIISEMILKSDYRSLHVDTIALVFNDAERAYDIIDSLEDLRPLFVEYYDARLFDAAAEAGKIYPFYDSTAGNKVVLLVAFDDFNQRHREKMINRVSKLATTAGASATKAVGIKSQDIISARNVGFYSYSPDQSGNTAPAVFGRFFVPKVQFDAFCKGLAELEDRLHVALPLSGWALAGSYAIHPVLSLSKTADKQKLFKILDELNKLVAAHKGAFITDGGEGQLKASFVEQSRPEHANKLYSDIKAVCDPHGILAPGVKVGGDLRRVITLLK